MVFVIDNTTNRAELEEGMRLIIANTQEITEVMIIGLAPRDIAELASALKQNHIITSLTLRFDLNIRWTNSDRINIAGLRN